MQKSHRPHTKQTTTRSKQKSHIKIKNGRQQELSIQQDYYTLTPSGVQTRTTRSKIQHVQ